MNGIEAAVQTIIAAVISTYEDAVQWLEDSSDNLANVLFEERPLTNLSSCTPSAPCCALPTTSAHRSDANRHDRHRRHPPQGRKVKAARDPADGRHWGSCLSTTPE